MSNSFVQVIRADGTPGQLYGPYEYAEAEAVLRQALKAGKNDNGPVEITAEVEEAISDDGFWSFDGGGGIFIVQSEAYSEEIDEDAFSEYDGSLYHEDHGEESLGEFQDERFVPSRYLLELSPEWHQAADAWATNWIGEQQEEDRRDHKRGLYGDR